MSDILPLLAGAVVVNDFLLTRLLGLPALTAAADPFHALLRVLAFLATALALSTFISHGLLQMLPAEFDFLRLFVFMLSAALLFVLALPWLRTRISILEAALPLVLPLRFGNAAVIGAAVVVSEIEGSAAASLASIGIGAGVALAQLMYFMLRDRVAHSDAPAAFRGMPIALLSLGMLSLALLGFAGLRV